MSPRSHRPLPTYARRLNAARDLKGWTVEELAEAIPAERRYGLSKSTLEKAAAGRRPLREHEYPLLAELLEVPEWFLRGGLEAAPGPAAPDRGTADDARELRDELLGRFDRLDGTLEQLRDQLSRLAEAATRR